MLPWGFSGFYKRPVFKCFTLLETHWTKLPWWILGMHLGSLGLSFCRIPNWFYLEDCWRTIQRRQKERYDRLCNWLARFDLSSALVDSKRPVRECNQDTAGFSGGQRHDGIAETRVTTCHKALTSSGTLRDFFPRCTLWGHAQFRQKSMKSSYIFLGGVVNISQASCLSFIYFPSSSFSG